MIINEKLLTNEELEYQWIAYLKKENRDWDGIQKGQLYCVLLSWPRTRQVCCGFWWGEPSYRRQHTRTGLPGLSCSVSPALFTHTTLLPTSKETAQNVDCEGWIWDAVSKIVLVSCSLTLGSSPLWAFYCAHLKLSTVVKWRHAPVWHSSLLSYEEDGMQSPHRVTEEMTLSSASFLPKD